MRRQQQQRGFTLIELMAVIVIIGILLALLIPAINGAVKTARNGAAYIELTTISQALANFKAKYHCHPPSRIVVSESGNYTKTFLRAAAGDEAANLSDRSVHWLRRMWPKFDPTAPTNNKNWFDYNGNGVNDFTTPDATKGVYVLNGPECLVFFLGGVPDRFNGDQWAVKGFSASPANPVIPINTPLGTNRSSPLYDFTASRLVDTNGNGFPELADSITGKPVVYFSAYEGVGYDPDDCNFVEEGNLTDGTPVTGIGCRFYSIRDADNPNGGGYSPGPNPYTNGPSLRMPGTSNPEFINKLSYQLIVAGYDGSYGIGGWYAAKKEDPIPLPVANSDPKNFVPEFAYPVGLARNARGVERDNITNFTGGKIN